MNIEEMRFRKISAKDYIPFKCTGCAECCKHVEMSVPLEPLDMFRIAKFMRNRDMGIKSIDDLVERYAAPVLLDDGGYFVYFLKTKGEEDACIFLENNSCMIHEVNPRACRLYPFSINPEDMTYLISCEREHHFSGPAVKVKKWMNQFFTWDDREYMELDYGAAVSIAKLLRTVPKARKKEALFHFMLRKYSMYDLEKPFLEQFKRNQAALIEELKEFVKLN